MSLVRWLSKATYVSGLTYRLLFTSIMIVQLVNAARKRDTQRPSNQNQTLPCESETHSGSTTFSKPSSNEQTDHSPA